MTEQEKKELELFKEWFNKNGSMGFLSEYQAAEESWFARAKLAKLAKDKFAPLNTFGYMDNTE